MIPKDKLHVLLVEDNPGDVELVRLYLEQEPKSWIELSSVPTLGAAREAIDPKQLDLVLLDLGLPDGAGIEVVGTMRQMATDVPIVVLTGRNDPNAGIEALKRDAQDYLVKDQLDAPTLRRSIRYAVERHRWQQQYRHQLSVSPDGTIVLDELGNVRFANAAAAALLGGAHSHVATLPEGIRLAHRGPSDVTLETGRIVEARSVETAWRGEPACLITLRDITGRRRAERALNRLTSELRSTNERLEELVSTDPLTDVLNRRGAEEALGTEIRRMNRARNELAAVLIDFDDFKRVNDAYGHAVGDAALRALTFSVRQALRAGDHVGRVGGDEFLVLLPATTIVEGFAVAEKLRQTIKSTTLPVAEGDLALSASLAIGTVGPHVVALEEVLASLNSALREGKQGGKDQVCAQPGPGVSGLQSGRARKPAHSDVTEIELRVALQEIRRIDTEEVIGFEALTRGPPGPHSTPVDLFRAAFESNVLTTLDLRALAASIDVLRREDIEGSLHVNVFPSTILNTPTQRIVDLCSGSAGRGRLCLELSEQQFLGDPSYLLEALAGLRDNGIRVGVDDVGFGRSSIEALIVLEPDVVKVDRSCVRSVDTDPTRRRQLERLIGMLAIIATEVIVEGVETVGELEVIRDLGISLGQGFLWGEPELVAPVES